MAVERAGTVVEESGGIVITLRDMYGEMLSGHKETTAAIAAVNNTLARIDTHLSTVDTRNKTADDLHVDHESRLRALERFKYTIMGGSAFVGIFSGALSSYIVGLVFRK